MRGFRLKKGVTIAPIPDFHLPEINIYPPQAGMEFEIAEVEWQCESDLEAWKHVALSISAATGHLGIVGMAGYASVAPIFRHHETRDFYEFLRKHILTTLALNLEHNPDHYERIELLESADPLEGEFEDGEDEISVENLVDSARDEVAEAIQELEEKADVAASPKGEERMNLRGERRHLRSIRPREAVNALTRLGFQIFDGARHTRIAGLVNGQMRTRNLNIHVPDDQFPMFLNEVLKFFRVDRGRFFEALR